MSKVFIEESTLSAIGNAIRNKSGKTDLIAPQDMSNEITNLPSGGGGDVEHLVLTGDCSYGCRGKIAQSYMDLYGNTISTNNITDTAYMFSYYAGKSVPFALNMSHPSSGSNMSYTFQLATNLTELPEINNAYPSNLGNFFTNCNHLREIPENLVDTWDFSKLNTYNYGSVGGMFQSCYSLRKIPEKLLKNLYSMATSSSYVLYYSLAYYCYAMDRIVGVPVFSSTLTSNTLSSTLSSCSRLSDFIFETNEDGTPKTAKWKSQTFDCSLNVGWVSNKISILNYNSGITEDKQVIDDATYQALKDDPDWFSTNLQYSRYNHDSAVRTINSLPDTSAYGTNTIKFRGQAGELTDGGAINTLTAEEIAIATAKGWTVTLV